MNSIAKLHKKFRWTKAHYILHLIMFRLTNRSYLDQNRALEYFKSDYEYRYRKPYDNPKLME